MIIFRTPSGSYVEFFPSRWGLINVYPSLERAVRCGRLERVS